MERVSKSKGLVSRVLLASFFAALLAPKNANAISKANFRKCTADALAATAVKNDTAVHEALTIAACYAAYKLEHKQASISPIGQSFLDGMAPSEFLEASSTGILSFEFIDPGTGLPSMGPSVGSVLYEESSTPDVSGSFTPLGSSNNAANNFSLIFTATDTEQDILAIPLDFTGSPIVITGVDGLNVAEGDVVQLNQVPEPSTIGLFGVGAVGVLGLSDRLRRRRVAPSRVSL